MIVLRCDATCTIYAIQRQTNYSVDHTLGGRDTGLSSKTDRQSVQWCQYRSNPCGTRAPRANLDIGGLIALTGNRLGQDMLAYLVIREGTKWTDVFRLIPGQAVTIGRAPTNQIVIKDERCSRAHAEVFHSQGKWILRDLESRNGTAVGTTMVHGDHVLHAGDMIRIGQSQLAFVHDLAKAFPDSSAVLRNMNIRSAAGTAVAEGMDETMSVLTESEPTTITHRRGQTRFLEPTDDEVATIPKVGRAAAQLCRLAFELAKAPDINSISRLALAGVFEGTQIDAGAVLLLPRTAGDLATGADLEILASRTDTDYPYHRVSNFLAATVLREGEAVLARNVMGDSTLGSRDSKGEIHATSVICAPIRSGPKVTGLIHLYSTNPDRIPDPDDLEFTLAVADTVAVALENLSRRQELAENLSQIRDENVQLRERLGVESEIVGNSPAMDSVNREIEPCRAEPGDGADPRRKRRRQGTGRPGGAFFQSAAQRAVRLLELRGLDRELAGKRTVRPRARRVHRRHRAQDRQVRGGRHRHADARRNRRDESHDSGQVSARARRASVRARRRQRGDQGRRARHRRHESRSGTGRRRRSLPPRSLFPAARVGDHRAGAAQAARRHSRSWRTIFCSASTPKQAAASAASRPPPSSKCSIYRWPGNVRELKNVIERAVVLARGDVIDVEDLTLTKLSTAGDTQDIVPVPGVFEAISLDEIERRHILATLQATGWNKSQTANILGIERSTLDRKIRRYELDGQFPFRGH